VSPMQLPPGGRLRYAISGAYVFVFSLAFVLLLIFPRRLKCFVCIIPSLTIGVFMFYVTGAVVSENIPNFPAFIKIAFQIVTGIVIFIILMIFALKIFPYAPRSKDDDSNVTQDPTLLKYDDDD
jgi:hypothetical protein